MANSPTVVDHVIKISPFIQNTAVIYGDYSALADLDQLLTHGARPHGRAAGPRRGS